MSPGQPMQIANPLQWQLAYGAAPNGTQVCILILTQGALQAQIQVSAEDMTRLGQGLLDTAKQSRTGLIIPSGVTLTNGHREGGGDVVAAAA